MGRMRKDEILDRLVFSESAMEAYALSDGNHKDLGGDHWSRPVLLERSAYLRKLARFSEGSASETIREFPGYSMILTVLLRSADAVMHEENAQILMVLDGCATLVSGGTLERPKRAGPEQRMGSAIVGGASRELRNGDVIHLPAGTPYQLLLGGEKAFSCLVVQVRETAPGG